MEIEIYGLEGLTQKSRFLEYSSAQFTERKVGVGGWRLAVPVGAQSPAAAQLAASTWGGIEAWDPATNWRFGGYLTSIQINRTAEGAEIVFAGNDFQTELQNRLDWPDASDVSFWWRNVAGGAQPLTTELNTIVSNNCGPDAQAFRRIDGLVIAADPNAGLAPARRLRGRPVLEVIAEMVAGQSRFARLRLERPITQLVPSGRLLFEVPEVATARTSLSVEQGDVKTLRTTKRADRATFLIGMGASTGSIPEPSERHVSTAATVVAGWETRYREAFHNRPGASVVADLTEELGALLAEAGGGQRVKVEGVQVSGFGPEGDLDIGDQVPVSIGEGAAAVTELLDVNASTLTFTERTGWERSVDVGEEELVGDAAVRSDLGRLAARIRQLESELTT